LEHDLNGYIIWEISGDLMQDLSTPLIDAVHHKLADPSLDCKTLAYDKSTFSGYSVVPGIPKPVTMTVSSSGGGTANGPSVMACPSVFYWGKSQYDGCAGYFDCVNGSPDSNSLTMCDEGTLYDEVSFSCIDSSLVTCSVEPSSPRPLLSSAVSDAVDNGKSNSLACPSDFFWGKLQYNGCTGYFDCVNGQPRDDSLTMCPDGTLFNEMSSQCTDASLVNCSEKALNNPTIQQPIQRTSCCHRN
jgi:hypothetical protein